MSRSMSVLAEADELRAYRKDHNLDGPTAAPYSPREQDSGSPTPGGNPGSHPGERPRSTSPVQPYREEKIWRLLVVWFLALVLNIALWVSAWFVAKALLSLWG